jgi:hypothetical protein
VTEALLARCIDGEPRLAGLDATLGAVVGPACRVVAVRKLTNRVYRVSLTIDGRSLSLVAKRLRSPVAGRIQLALERWLPQAGLARAAPGLVGVSPDPGAHHAWHLYEDLGTRTLAHAAATPAAFERAVQLVATIHARFAQESTLAEWRIRGEDHGLGFYESSVRGAIDGVEAVIAGCDRRTVNVAGARRLRARLEGLSQKRA